MFALKLFYCLVLINLILLTKCSNINKYCGRQVCNDTQQHTLCKYQSKDPARHCIDLEITFKAMKEKLAILDKLNSRRNKVASGEIKSLPPAKKMMKLEWNDDLALSAQRWANQCVKHDIPDIKDVCRDLETMKVGQNIATISGESPGLTPVALVDVWYMQLLNFNASVLPSFQPPNETRFSHYDYFTQLVWADSSQVGCGGVKFKERIQGSTDGKNRWIYRLICNFAPSGNIKNHSVYTHGDPCSGCDEGFCDTTYKSLCNAAQIIDNTPVTIKNLMINNDDNATIVNEVISEVVISTEDRNQHGTIKTASTTKEEDYTPFDYFSHLHQFTTQSLTPSQNVICKDILAVDEFVDLLKKKLSTDPMFKELFMTTKTPNTNDASYGDATVAALVSRLYSKKSPLTTTKLLDKEHVNSTLLVNLVEAVIFRKDKTRYPTVVTEFRNDFEFDVSPVKIQAELGEIKQNADFTGHYFFPEDEDTKSEATSDTPEIYYDASNVPMADVMKEIEDFKRIKATKDFLDEILDTDPATESSTTTSMSTANEINLYKVGRSNMRKFLKDIGWEFHNDNKTRQNNILKMLRNEKKRNKRKYPKDINYADEPEMKYNLRVKDSHDCHNLTYTCSEENYGIKYVDLLKKIATDFKILKLNERFHCSRNTSSKFYNIYFYKYLMFVFILLYKTTL